MSKKYKCSSCVLYCEMDLEREPKYCMLDGEKAKWEEVKEDKKTVLPKLTAEVFDRPDCPEWAKWVAVDGDGEACFFADKPAIFKGKWWDRDVAHRVICDLFDPSDWQNSLIERPIKLPDWVEVGGYVYDKRNGYGKIVSGSVKSCYIEFHGGAGDFVPEAFSKLQQARLRPYNEKEMKHMVGQVVLSKNGDVALVTDYDSSDQEVLIAGAWYNAKRLLASAWLHVNNPCGVLEHLEDGEWVE